METTKLKRFAQYARRSLRDQVETKLNQVLAEESAARRESAAAIRKLEEAIQKHTKDQVIERVAYIWFNRFCALRFMDVNRYNRVGIVSPADPGQFQPEILAEAKMGHIDEEMVHDKIRQQIFALLDGNASSRDPQGEAYRLLVVATCNYWNKAMPFLFQRIDDYTELLMPDDLLSGNSILSFTREAMTPDLCGVASEEETSHWPLATSHSGAAGGVEVIGWLYQFYISEKKDEVFDGLKKNKKITPENIPAATQLFTPHWIVRYLVENSLGRLWMLNRPGSKLAEQMDYYIAPVASDQGLVASEEETNHWPLTTSHSEYFLTPVASDQGLVAGEEETSHWPLTTSHSEYFLTPVASDQGLVAGEEETSHSEDFLRISKPEEIKLCDPACGSGHMLTYAFDLLYAIYEEEGYEPAEIPEKILTHNLYGIEIDERAGELAAFALSMKARSRSRRFFRRPVRPNICVLENVTFDDGELGAVVSDQWLVASGASRADIFNDLNLFEEANNFGSLLRPHLTSEQCTKLWDYLTGHWSLGTSHSISEYLTHQKVLQALRQADYLSQKYHVVIANPPYMGGKGMNGRLGAWAKDNYPDSKSDLFSMFIERILSMISAGGYTGLMTPFTWMFLTSFESLRSIILNNCTITSLVRPEYHSFFESAYVPICGLTIFNRRVSDLVGSFIDLNQFYGAENQPIRLLEAINNHDCGWFHAACSNDFLKIPGSPIAYWISEKARGLFEECLPVGRVANVKQGLITGDNDQFLRFWNEIEFRNIGLGFMSRNDASETNKRWFPHHKGGAFRKWYGNHEYVVDWEKDGEKIRNFFDENGKQRSRPQNLDYYFKPAVTWTSLTVASFNARLCHGGFIYDAKGPMVSPIDQEYLFALAGLLNCCVTNCLLKLLAPTMDYNQGPVSKLPWPNNIEQQISSINDTVKLLEIRAKSDWDSYETSWDFRLLELLQLEYRQPTLKATYQKLLAHWRYMTLETQRLEQENNRIFIEAYGLQDELKPEVPLNEITLTCNPHYRYGLSGQWLVASDQQKEEELEKRLLEDTIKELLSYAVGCMFGRYSLDMPGLVLANQGETLADYLRKVAEYRQTLATGHSPLATQKSDQWPVASKKGEINEREALQGSDCVAESHGLSSTGLSSNEAISEGRAIRPDESDTPGSSFDSFQHSGGTSKTIDGGVQKLSVDSAGLIGGSRNATSNCDAAQLSESRTTGINHGGTPGNQQNDSGADGKTGHWPLDTSHLSFVPDEDNVIPILDGDWFTDDITERFRQFLRVAFGEAHYEENLQFVEQALNVKGKREYSIRDYFLGEFYTDHVKRYKKRPIYWLFSSPKGSFNALIYMHRYRPDTVSVVLNDYLREFRTKLTAHKNHLEAVSISASAAPVEKTKALKEIEKINKMIAELEEYEREVLYPLATQQIDIDLDDGVKVNYPKFGAALKKIPGLDAQDE